MIRKIEIERFSLITSKGFAILNGDGKLVAQVTSTVMTLRGEKASGR